MTEAEWFACTDPRPMLEFLRGKASERKFRLFAVACCRYIWHLICDERSRNAVEVAERLADGMVTEEERRQSLIAAEAAMHALYPANGNYAAQAVVNAVSVAASTAIHANVSALTAAHAVCDDDDPTSEAKWQAERICQVSVLHHIFGNPFRPVAVDPFWLTPSVVAVAQTIYEDRQFEDMPILADALDEAECDNAAILSHCRLPGPHVRGCWVLDQLLGKE
jgi:hypothetical protein